jgi:hypothetical protein
VKDARQLTLHVVVAAVAGFRRDRYQRVFQDRLAVGLDALSTRETLQEIGDLSHFQMSVGAELLVHFLLIKVVPPFMAAAAGAGCFPLTAVIEVEYRAAVVLVFAFQPDAFARGEERDGTEAHPIRLDRERVQVGHQAPFGDEVVQRDVDPLTARIGLATMSDLRSSISVRRLYSSCLPVSENSMSFQSPCRIAPAGVL